MHATESKRVGGYQLLATIGQCGPVLGVSLFPDDEKPYFRKGMWVSCAFCLLVFLLSAVLSLLLMRENRRLEREEGGMRDRDHDIMDAPGTGNSLVEGKFRYII